MSTQTTKALQEEHWLETVHQQWVSTLDAIRDAIIVVNSDGRIVRANQSFATMVSRSFPQITKSTVTDLLPWAVNADGQLQPGQVLAADGRLYEVRSPEGSIADDGRVFILEDVTRLSALEKIESEYEQGNTRALISTIDALSFALASKDPYTFQHSEQVAKLAKNIALSMGLDELESQGIFYGARVHDIGKLNIPSGILNKPGRLAEAEMNLIQMHCETGYAIVKHMEFPWPVHEIVLQHHERLDGSGYPAGLTADEIHIGARITAVADIFEAMSAHRPYRAALGSDAAIAEITKQRGKSLDADAVDACIAVASQPADE